MLNIKNGFRKISFYLFYSILIINFFSCNFITTMMEMNEDKSTVDFSSTSVTIAKGEMEVLSIKISDSQNNKTVSWSYDSSIIDAVTDNYGMVITGIASGTTTVKATLPNGNSASCYITVTEDIYSAYVANPYIYCSSDFVEVTPGGTVRLSASLYGGRAGDASGYTWSIDKSSVATLSTEGNYCWITGANEGMAKLSVRHNRAAYPYTVLISCTSDGTASSYITTSDNIVTINMSEDRKGEFSVDLMNPVTPSYESGFTYKIVDSLGNELSDAPVTISGAGSLSVNLHAYKTGECFVRCSHPSAMYSLDVLIRVVQDEDTSFLNISDSIVTLTGAESYTVNASLLNYSGTENKELYSWNFSEGAEDIVSWTVSDNILRLTGKKTGSAKATVSYPGLSSRSVVILVRNLVTEAASAKTYITTSQNYIKMYTDSDPEKISITLTDCEYGDNANLKWNIINCPDDGVSNVIKWTSGNGTASSKVASRSALLTYNEYGYCVIEPVSPGTAYIDISHPKAIYSTRITVTVKENSSVTEARSFLSLTDSPVVKIKNGETETLKVQFSGSGAADDIEWYSASEVLTLTPNGTICSVYSPEGSGSSVSSVTVSHPDSQYPVTFSVINYDLEEDLETYNIKSIYSTDTKKTINIGNEETLLLSYTGFNNVIPNINWTCVKGNNSVISIESASEKTSLVVHALSAGEAVIKASCADCADVMFMITVKNPGIIDKYLDCYLSTTTNVLYFENIDDTQDIYINANNISESFYSQIEWECDSPYFEVYSNGNCATVKALSSNAGGTITVSHPLSENTLTVYLKSGNQYEFVNTDVCYITTDSDVLNLYAGQDEVALYAKLNHTNEDEIYTENTSFSFVSSDESVAEVSYVFGTSVCYVKPLKMGTAKITVTNSEASYPQEIAVIVEKAPESDSIPYLTTNQNVINFIKGDYTTVSVTLKNSDNIANNNFEWKSSDEHIVSVVANNGSTAMLSANGSGTAQVIVKHSDCIYSLKLIVTVLDSSVTSSIPYISTSTGIVTLSVGESQAVTAEMLGETVSGSDRYFKWTCSDSSVALANGTYGSCYIKALSPGMTYITVTNSRYASSYSRTVLVIVEETAENGVSITASSSIIKMRPNDTEGVQVTASIVNGEATDAEDFIWWADDYNIVAVTNITNVCQIVPLGKSGTTKVHVKHPKASKQVDIIVLISNYDSFAFCQDSARITAETLNFFPLQVPAIEDTYTIKYSSSNEDVCIIDGSNSVAFVCGKSYGTASLTATMYSSTDVELARAEMLVSVSVLEPSQPSITLGKSIINLEGGSSQVFTAVINGENLTGDEKYGIEWNVIKGEDGISINDGNDKHKAYGPSCYVTVDDVTDEYVIEASLPGTEARVTCYVVVSAKGEIDISLSSNLETMYKDDGSITLTAELTNGSASDYQSISWSAVKVGGSSIVSVSKSKGKTCTVTPKMVGQTSVIAKLPNGKTAKCIVIVKANAEVFLTVGTVHVIPGYTVSVPYVTTPENSTVNWYAQYSTSSSSLGSAAISYFTFEDDKANKQLLITGKSDYTGGEAGTISGIMSGASSANIPKLSVFVEYNIDVEIYHCDSENALTLLETTRPDSNNIQKFDVVFWPSDLIISVTGYENLCNLYDYTDREIVDNGLIKTKRTYQLQPKSEGQCTIEVKGKLPNDTNETYAKSESFTYSAFYEDYDISVTFMNEQVGAFTKWNGKELELGDGEQAVFYFTVKNENANGTIGNAKIINAQALGGHNKAEFGVFEGKADIKINNDLPGKSRDDVKNQIFDDDYKNKVKPGNEYDPGTYDDQILSKRWYKHVADTALSLDPKQLDNGPVVYYLAHNFDWYKDLPKVLDEQGKVIPDSNNNPYDLNNDGVFERYYNDKGYKNLDMIEALIKQGCDWWQLSGIPYKSYNNKKYYALDYTSKKQADITISTEKHYMEFLSVKGNYSNLTGGAWKLNYTKFANYVEKMGYNDFNTLYLDKLLEWTEPFHDCLQFERTQYEVHYSSNGVSFPKIMDAFYLDKKESKISPFFDSLRSCNVIISAEELKNSSLNTNKAFTNYCDSKKSELKTVWDSFTKNWGNKDIRSSGEHTMVLPSLQCNSKYIKPVVSKNQDAVEIGNFWIEIPYTNGHNQERYKRFQVHVKKRDCMAYTNSNWKKDTNYTKYERYKYTGTADISVADIEIETEETQLIELPVNDTYGFTFSFEQNDLVFPFDRVMIPVEFSNEDSPNLLFLNMNTESSPWLHVTDFSGEGIKVLALFETDQNGDNTTITVNYKKNSSESSETYKVETYKVEGDTWTSLNNSSSLLFDSLGVQNKQSVTFNTIYY